ncbi:helix-turn-helix transcriptional regulator [Teredinibacter sp. KSP-S5-2]|uniref:helix-turn-helix domain-containing protein n=1 Tax=Teredinibacter sp. KSP-S5-2 TaxID=3034506 RepID=UPI002934EBAE|nr:helix-turn-helix transcriptional regulator [Teredinibacter sp. KSP-S5-2]WNO08395.1 helix-turn-helix transcriptional regulator [Teredinibacter sp. KSP-S5-2]
MVNDNSETFELPREKGYDPERGKRIKHALIDAGVSNSEVTSRLEVSRTTLNNWLAGAPMNSANLYNLCALLNAEVKFILEGISHFPNESRELHTKIDLMDEEQRKQLSMLADLLLSTKGCVNISVNVDIQDKKTD